MRRAPVLLAAAALVAGAFVTPARGDGDPASDYLIAQPIFWPIDASISAAAKSELVSTVAQAKDRGFEVRVAVIWSAYDLGSVGSLWRKPQRYARFLAAEITYFYKGRLLVVMPNGFGFVDPTHGSTRAVLDGIRIEHSPTGLTQAASRAVTALAAARGIRVHASGQSGGVSTKDVLVAVGLGLVLVPVAALAFAAVRRHRPHV